ncbi:PD-(D/E)XK nuclease superfamily protein [Winogradskyella pacifica]|uniref:PD-(D/E)XK nuclease superfamily protein n=1 Tax=Winogradskyella pacifica TaxID=664642 RepID=A0A3D9LMH6_9FLAO|nr:PD-(D/E)XK nuclease family protein [Winogradskyella pacifica]REE08631.1 PD-(D/E)XK nuclease superfamily protein [Winogradskyella pacifica]
MFKKIIFTISFVIISCLGYAQKNMNDYKYIIIPKAYEFSKSDDQYQLNSLTKFLFNKYGYDAYFVEELPEDLKSDRCLGLIAEVSNDEGSLFKTKLEIILKDCYDVVIMKSQIGESRVKDYKKAYNEALREAFETFQNFNYEYASKESVEAKPKEEKQSLTYVEVKETSKIEETKVKPKDVTTKTAAISSNEVKQELYYAQAITNGFQLVNSEPKVVMILLNSSAKDVFIVKDKNAIVFNKEGQWMYSENNGASTIEKILNIKF